MAADGEGEKEVVGKAVEVRQRQDGQCVVARHEVKHLIGKVTVGPDGAVGEHHAFAPARGTAGVTESA